MTTSTLSEVLKQARDYIENVPDDRDSVGHIDRKALVLSLNQSIKELESQEPVGRFAKFTDGVWRPVTDYSAGVPLYTTPPQRTWVGLTDMERQMTINKHEGVAWETAIAIEQQLKGKNI